MTPISVADGVYVAVGTISALLRSADPPAYAVRAAAAMPRWRAREHLAARILLRQLLAGALGDRAAQAPVRATAGGQPYLPGLPGIGVSLSHAGDLVSTAVSTSGGAVGVDVEPPRDPDPALASRCCGPAAAAALAAWPAADRSAEFSRMWTVKEACVKARGRGLAGAPWRVPVWPGQRSGTWDGLRWRSLPLPVPVSCAYAGPERKEASR